MVEEAEMLTNLEDLLAVVMESMETLLQMVLTSKQRVVYGTLAAVAVLVVKAPDLWMVV